jgi:hypothetical protein
LIDTTAPLYYHAGNGIKILEIESLTAKPNVDVASVRTTEERFGGL